MMSACVCTEFACMCVCVYVRSIRVCVCVHMFMCGVCVHVWSMWSMYAYVCMNHSSLLWSVSRRDGV